MATDRRVPLPWGKGGTAVTIFTRIVPLAAALVATLAIGTSSGAAGRIGGVDVSLSFGDSPALKVATLHPGTGSGVYTGIISGGNSTPVAPAQVTVDLAAGYTLSPQPAGLPVGIASVAAVSGSRTGFSLGLISGELTTDDPSRYTNDPAAQACAPGPYLAVWKLSASVFGLSFALPVFVTHPASSPQRLELRFCPPPLTDAAGKPATPTPVPLANVDFLLFTVSGPGARGRYLSSALITPQSATGSPDAASTVEARSLEPVPHTLTLKGRYDAKTRDAVLTGRVTETGRSQRGAKVEYFDLDSLSRPRQVRTSAAGTFRASVRITTTRRFVAQVPDETGDCTGASAAPRGCASLTVVGSNAREVRVVVPRR